jgi:hypothetical protein
MAQKYVNKQDDAALWSASLSPQAARRSGGAPSSRENWFDSSWELRQGLQVDELEDLPSAFGDLAEAKR